MLYINRLTIKFAYSENKYYIKYIVIHISNNIKIKLHSLIGNDKNNEKYIKDKCIPLNNMKFSVSILALVLISFSLINPVVDGLSSVDNDTSNEGKRGEVITYLLSIKNDNLYPVDVKLKIDNTTWEAEILEDEKENVQPNDYANFTLFVTIPFRSEILIGITNVSYWEKRNSTVFDEYLPLNNDYHMEYAERIETKLIEEDETTNLSETLKNNYVFLPIIFIFAIFSSYLWHGRKYFFLAPFYMNIPKEKLLNNENREKISRYLTEYNGSNLSEISHGTNINIQTLRHHMKLFEQSNVVLRKEKRFFIKKPGSEVFDTEILSPVMQRVFDIIRTREGISVTQLVEETGRSKPWIGNRLYDLQALDLVEIVKVGRFKYIYPKGSNLGETKSIKQLTTVPING